MILRQALAQAAWHLRMTRHGLALRIGRSISLLLIVGALGASFGHAIVRRATWLDQEDDASADGT